MLIIAFLEFLHVTHGQLNLNMATQNDADTKDMIRIVSLPRVPIGCTHFVSSGEYCHSNSPGPSTQWYFDPFTQRCQPFLYRGCGGTPNRFANKNECLHACGCFGSKNIGNVPCGSGNERRFAFDQSTSRCVGFDYSACGGGNDNNFQSSAECEDVCGLNESDFDVHNIIRGSSATVQAGQSQSVMITGISALSRKANRGLQPRRIGITN